LRQAQEPRQAGERGQAEADATAPAEARVEPVETFTNLKKKMGPLDTVHRRPLT